MSDGIEKGNAFCKAFGEATRPKPFTRIQHLSKRLSNQDKSLYRLSGSNMLSAAIITSTCETCQLAMEFSMNFQEDSAYMWLENAQVYTSFFDDIEEKPKTWRNCFNF